MDQQSGYRPYDHTDAFADGRVMREPPRDSVPYEPHREPVHWTLDTVRHGRALYDGFCSPCHGLLGDSNTVVAGHMAIKPTPLTNAHVRSMSTEDLIEATRLGVRLMPPFAAVLTHEETAEVIAYVESLQLSQDVALNTLPSAVQQQAMAALGGP